MSGAYYNEIDPHAAQWLRNLIAAGHIAAGHVDERSIEDVQPDDLRGYSQCHFFAGIGVWSYALRRAGWPDDRPVWTGSCPCQPFSAAGKGGGFDDERHLWPHWHWLIAERRPAVVFGEQVASSAVDDWIDLVQTDVEALDYAYGCVPFPSAGVGAPHIRDRTFWLAYANSGIGREGSAFFRGWIDRSNAQPRPGSCSSMPDRLADAHHHRFQGSTVEAVFGTGRRQEGHEVGCGGRPLARRVGDSDDLSHGAQRSVCSRQNAARVRGSADEPAGPANGFWRDADWLLCRDGKWRPVEPGTFPLAHGAPGRVGRLRAYGNAVNGEATTAFIRAARAAIGDYELC
ncbi:putative methyl transferase protein [Burkholderia phage BcepC6B]|uniref:Putative methyl transferase protein n=1 Tax=Burkholderia phage BcepC6B TaxID=2883949 RepID=Q6J1P4_9CAUD|nr:DNA methyltransferase [Burkholderia phage BcepC6B]AAT38392.1 putative methyl transferase protein [Burkholderia phage BcepC6B]